MAMPGMRHVPAVLPALAWPLLLHGQTAPWQRSAELGANVWYGAAHARVVSTALAVAHTDSSLAVRADGRFGYADNRDDDGPRQVIARAFELSTGIDYRPLSRYSPFLFAGAESSLQERIARRFNAGAGVKLTLRHKERDDVSVSLALLNERTWPAADAGTTAPLMTRTRWSLRFRYRRQLTEGLYASHVTFYQPSVANPTTRYTVNAVTALEQTVTSVVSLTMTLRHRYDSEARARGAASDNDGQFVVGLKATF